MSAIPKEVAPEPASARGPNPFVGPKPFEKKDEDYFFGRDHEAQQLVAHILTGPITLLYAESGAGKTSLLRAKVIPTLERGVQTSVQPRDAGTPIGCEILGNGRVSGPAMDGSRSWPNVFTANVLMTFMTAGELAETPDLTLTEYLKARPYRIPPKKTAVRPPRVLFLDQFEELFTTGSEWWSHREPFFRDLGEALDADPRLRVVLAMREEYIANLDAFVTLVPGALRTRFRLQRLREKQGVEAVRKPLAIGGVTIEDAALAKLMDSLRAIPGASGTRDRFGEFIEPLHLQVVCSRLWTSLAENDQVITEQMVTAHGDIDAALTAYYEDCIREVLREHQRFREGQIRAWFERELITEHKTRGIVFRGDKMAGTLPNEVVDSIQKRYLIRPELRGGGQWYELSHDRMIQPVLASGQKWRELQRGNEIVRKIEDGAREYAASPATTPLISADVLREAHRFLGSEEGRGYAWTPLAREYVQDSELAAQQGRARRMRLLAVACFVGFLAAAGAVFGVLELKEQADRAVWQTEKKVAETFLRQKKNFDALVWAVRAYGTLRKQDERPPESLIDVLREASNRVGDDVWLRPAVPISDVEFSLNGRYAATLGEKQVCLWDLKRLPKPICNTIPENENPRSSTSSVPFISDERSMSSRVSVSFVADDGKAIVLDGIEGVEFILDGKLKVAVAKLASVDASQSGLIVYVKREGERDDARWISGLYDIAARETRELDLPKDTTRMAWLSPFGNFIIRRSSEDTTDLWSLKDGIVTPIALTDDKAKITGASFSPDEKRALVFRTIKPADEVGPSERKCTIYETDTWTPLASFSVEAGQYLRSNIDGSRFIRATREGFRRFVLHEVDLHDRQLQAPVSVPITGLGGIGEQRYLFTNSDNEWTLWRPFENWTVAKTFLVPASFTKVRAVGPDDSDMIAAIDEGAVRIFKLHDGPRPTAKLSNDELFAKGCRQLKSQNEYADVKEICEAPPAGS